MGALGLGKGYGRLILGKKTTCNFVRFGGRFSISCWDNGARLWDFSMLSRQIGLRSITSDPSWRFQEWLWAESDKIPRSVSGSGYSMVQGLGSRRSIWGSSQYLL